MDEKKKERLKAKGWVIGNADDFLGLSKEEAAYIELKIALSKRLVKERKIQKITQIQLAERMKTSQSRISKMEKGDPKVSIDMILRSLIALGATKESLLSESLN